uniref:Putative ovule protein n=1 Tax=Solanum chacoense TaxID=4108 RepID=A0A0V0IHC4_SOLCH
MYLVNEKLIRQFSANNFMHHLLSEGTQVESLQTIKDINQFEINSFFYFISCFQLISILTTKEK